MNKVKKTIDMILNDVGHLSLLKSGSKLEKLGLYKGQPPLMSVLFNNDGCTQKEISEELGVTKATVSKTVSRMEAKGWLKVTKDPNDKRATRVFLTEKGRSLESELEDISKEMSSTILDGFSEEEKQTFESLLLKVKKNLL